MNNIVDEIKKEIEEDDFGSHFIFMSKLYSILNKYQDQEDVYKKMYDRLKYALSWNNEKLFEDLEKEFNIKEVE